MRTDMPDLDARVRLAAFAFLDRLRETHRDTLPYAQLLAGFDFEGRRLPLLAPQGIFKPAILDLPLSITTVPPPTASCVRTTTSSTSVDYCGIGIAEPTQLTETTWAFVRQCGSRFRWCTFMASHQVATWPRGPSMWSGMTQRR